MEGLVSALSEEDYFYSLIRKLCKSMIFRYLINEKGKIVIVSYLKEKFFQILICRPNGAVVREAGCCTRGSGFESRVRHG